MQSRNLINLVLAIALASLAVFIYLQTREGSEQDKTRLTNLKPEEIHSLGITNVRKENIVLEKSNGQWRLVHPFTAPANSERIQKILNIVSAASEAQYNVADADLKQLRLIDPDISLQVNQTLLEVGTTESLKQRRYLKVDDTIHLITDSYTYLAQGGAEDFVDSQLLAATNRIKALYLPDLTLKQNDKGWEVIDLQPRPSADLMQQLIDEWQQARALKVTHGVSPDPTAKIRIEFAGDSAPIEFDLARNESEIILSRADLDLAYHFTVSNGERLLSLPAPKKIGQE